MSETKIEGSAARPPAEGGAGGAGGERSARQKVDLAGVKWMSGNQPSGYQMINVFVVVFDRFNTQKRQAQEDCKHEADNLVATLAQLRVENCQGHRKATKN